jgi:dolichyl-phosphate beta-glucosyltransferase
VPETLLVVPCYNEEADLRVECFVEFAHKREDVDLLFVDDGSTDRTPERLRELSDRLGARAAVHTLPRNRGKAEAVRQGMLRAFERGPSFAGYWDADLATPLEALPEFIELLRNRPELLGALGSRVQLLGRRIERRAARHYGGRLYATLASLTLGLAVYDTQCGAKLFRVGAETRALFEEPFLANWSFDVEVLARLVAARRGRPGPGAEDLLCEIPLRRWRDVGVSKVRGLDFFRSLVELLRIRRRYL